MSRDIKGIRVITGFMRVIVFVFGVFGGILCLIPLYCLFITGDMKDLQRSMTD
jgi:hypothetical protein